MICNISRYSDCPRSVDEYAIYRRIGVMNSARFRVNIIRGIGEVVAEIRRDDDGK